MLDDKDVEQLRLVFVTRQECQETTSGLESKLNKDNVRLSVIENDLHQIKWLVGTVLATSLASLINSLLGLIGG